MVDTISRVVTEYVSNGADKAASDFKKVTTAQDALGQANVKVSQTTETLTRSMLSVQRQLDGQTRSLDPLSAATKKLADVEATRTRALQQGITLTEANNRAFENVRARVAELEKAVTGHTTAVGLNRNQQMELLHIGKSVFDQMAAGTPITRALTVEGGRIAQVFGSGTGGVGGAFGVAKTLLSSMLSPTVLLTGGITALGAAGALAFSQWNAGQEKLEASLNGMGRASGLTREMLEQIAQSGAGAAGIHPSDARDLAAGFNATGRIGPAMNQNLIGISKQFAIGTGLSLADGGEMLAKAFSDPAKGADLLNEKLGFLDGSTRDLIRSQTAQLDVLGAQKTLYAAVEANISNVVDRTWKLTQAAQAAVTVYQKIRDAAGSSIGSAVYQKTPAEQLADVNGQIARSSGLGRSPVLSMLGIGGSADQLGSLYSQRDSLSKSVYADERRRAAEAATDKSKSLSLEGADTIRVVMPDIDRFQRLVDQQNALARVAADPGAVAKLPGGIDETGKMASGAELLRQAMERATSGVANFKTGVALLEQQSSLNVQAIQAENFAVRASIEAERTRISALADNKSKLEAATMAETQRNEALATAAKQAQDAAREQRNSDALMGLKPAQRFATERDQALEGARREFGPVTGNSGAFAAAPADVQAMITAASAITGLPAAIIAAIGKVENGFKLSGPTGILGPNGKPASTAWGYGQLTDGAAADVAKVMPGFSKYDSSTAVLGSAQYLKILLGRSHGDITEALNRYGGRPDYASQIMGGGGVSSGDTSGIYSTKASSASDHYNKQMENLKTGIIDQATAGLDKQNQALELQKASFGASTQAIAEMAEKQQLLNQLNDAGLSKDPAMVAWANKMAASYGQAAKAADDLAKNQRAVTERMDAVRSISKDALSTFVTDLRNGKSAGDALLDVANQLVDKMLDMAENQFIDALFGKSGTAGGGLFGSMFSSGGGGGGGSAAAVSDAPIMGSLYHSGGVVGRDGAPRLAPMSAFAGAPRYHSGMGLGHDEMPAILQRGEAVVSKADLADARRARNAVQTNGTASGGGTSAPPVVHIHTDQGTRVADVKTSRGPNGEHMLSAFVVNSMLNDLRNGGKFSRALQSFSGSGRTGGS